MRHVRFVFDTPDTDKATAYARVSDFARYPDFTDQVVAIDLGAIEGSGVVSTWAVKFRKGLLRWTERDTFTPESGRIDFVQLSGDFAEFSGSWQVIDTDSGVEVVFDADFDLGIPTLADILDPVAENALRENITLILNGLLGAVREIEPSHSA
ncbi:type II toxin-antitoxin system RatA family toxin [Nocardia tengchongensis]|uniref:type II toxin-antitoxin system RatA family toxin n=1 Tax=Nocardia tengchongensis TaxID=2055889 RepID=UPI0036A696F8